MPDTLYDPNARAAAVARAECWMQTQAARLGYSPTELLAAIRRGWFPDQIEALPVAQADLLELSPAKALAAK